MHNATFKNDGNSSLWTVILKLALLSQKSVLEHLATFLKSALRKTSWVLKDTFKKIRFERHVLKDMFLCGSQDVERLTSEFVN